MSSNTMMVLHEVGSELKQNEPMIVRHTRAKYGKAAADAQLKAILLDKARKRGARITKGR